MDSFPKIKVAIIGFGRMGRLYLKEMSTSGEWDIRYICDTDPEALQSAATLAPEATLLGESDRIFADKTVEVVVLTALADSRKEQILNALSCGMHIITEKPLSDAIDKEWDVVRAIERSRVIGTVNLSLRNAWYNLLIKDFIQSGEIGELAIIRICHMTPGLVPGEGHFPEGPCFHDCGLHYVDFARWYAQSEYKTWHAQGLRMWSYPEPWWLQCHGTFENGIVFDITQGHVYGQLSKDQTHISYNDIIGTKGVARMWHDFKTAHIELRGVGRTQIIDKPFGDKNVDILCRLFARSVRRGKLDPRLPSLRDAATASEYAWKFLTDASLNDMPAIGSPQILEEIRNRRSQMSEGYGLLKPKKK